MATITFGFIDNTLQTFTVPAGVYWLTVTAAGASGGGSDGDLGGHGASITGDFAVTPGDALAILVGGAGRADRDGGDGGGGFSGTGLDANTEQDGVAGSNGGGYGGTGGAGGGEGSGGGGAGIYSNGGDGFGNGGTAIADGGGGGSGGSYNADPSGTIAILDTYGNGAVTISYEPTRGIPFFLNQEI